MDRIAEYGISAAAYQALFALRRIPNMSSAELARWTGVTAQGANQVLKGLIERELVERRPAATHGRILEARLTPLGERVIAACEQAGNELEAQMTAGFDDAERVQLGALLRRMAVGLGAPIAPGISHPARLIEETLLPPS